MLFALQGGNFELQQLVDNSPALVQTLYAFHSALDVTVYPNAFAPAQDDALLVKVCNGCGTECPGCVFDGGVPLCIDQIDNSYSSGGNVTLETLTILPGYWRATNTSPNVLACFKAAACRGGITGTPGYCDTGYEGPCE